MLCEVGFRGDQYLDDPYMASMSRLTQGSDTVYIRLVDIRLPGEELDHIGAPALTCIKKGRATFAVSIVNIEI